MRRRGLLAAALAMPALAQTDLLPMAQAPRPDDVVAPGYRRDVLIRWGDRVVPDAPAWTPRMPTVEGASGQFGWDGRLVGVAVPPAAADGAARAVVVVAHPEVWPAMAFAGPDRPDVASAMQGASLINLVRERERWIVAEGGFQARRLWARTLCRIAGPAAEAVGSAVQGLLNVQGGCVTPWGTLLLGEGDPADWLARLSADPAATDRASPDRFGWVAELDPLDPGAVPVKRTALGRFAHADIAARRAEDGRAVIYMTEGRPFGRLFRFVSTGPAEAADALDQGTLAVARIEGGGVRWEPLADGGARVAAEAAARAGGSVFDMPAGLAFDPRRQRLFLCCNGNAGRAPDRTDALNPRPANGGGHIVALDVPRGDPAAPRYAGRVLAMGGDPGVPGATVLPNPETLFADPAGRLWCGTDQGGRTGAVADGLFEVADGSALPLYLAPVGGALGGAALLPDGRTMLAVVRRPGATDGANFDRPATRWPQLQQGLPPRTTLVAITRSAGGPPGG